MGCLQKTKEVKPKDLVKGLSFSIRKEQYKKKNRAGIIVDRDLRKDCID